jgi:hypothetical protein
MPNRAEEVRLSTERVFWPMPPEGLGSKSEVDDVGVFGETRGDGLRDVPSVVRGVIENVPGRRGCGRRICWSSSAMSANLVIVKYIGIPAGAQIDGAS